MGRGQSRLARRPPSHLTARLQALRDCTAASHKREVESRKVAILKEQALEWILFFLDLILEKKRVDTAWDTGFCVAL